MKSTTPVRPYPLGERMRSSVEPLINKNMVLVRRGTESSSSALHMTYSHAVVLQFYLSASPEPSTGPLLPPDVLNRHAHLPVGNYSTVHHFFAIRAETLTLCKSLAVSSLSSLAHICIGASGCRQLVLTSLYWGIMVYSHNYSICKLWPCGLSIYYLVKF